MLGMNCVIKLEMREELLSWEILDCFFLSNNKKYVLCMGRISFFKTYPS